MTEQQHPAAKNPEPLTPHEVNRLLRAFHADLEHHGNLRFHYKATPIKSLEFTYNYQNNHHIVEVGQNFIKHTMRQGVTEIKTILYANNESGQISIKRQRRDFDFEKNELGDPVDVPIANVFEVNRDLNHMAHVSIRTMQAIEQKTAEQGQQGQARG